MSNPNDLTFVRQAISEEFEKRFFKVGKFKLCFPFSNLSADLSCKINSQTTHIKDKQSNTISAAANSSNLMKQLVMEIKRYY
jgi:hypothetical protein